jgi:hypothetical protein
LEDLPLQEVLEAIDIWIESYKFFPEISELREMVVPAQSEFEAYAAWMTVLAYVNDGCWTPDSGHRNYSYSGVKPKLTAKIMDIMRGIGFQVVWDHGEGDDQLQWAEKRFIEAWINYDGVRAAAGGSLDPKHLLANLRLATTLALPAETNTKEIDKGNPPTRIEKRWPAGVEQPQPPAKTEPRKIDLKPEDLEVLKAAQEKINGLKPR